MKHVYARFSEQIGFYGHKATKDRFNILWLYATDRDSGVSGNAVLSAGGLAHFCAIWFSTLQFKACNNGFMHRVMSGSLMPSIGSKVSLADLVVCAVILLQIGFLLMRVQCVAPGRTNGEPPKCKDLQWIVLINKWLSLFWAIEMIGRLSVYTVARYVQSRHVINGVGFTLWTF